MADKVAPTPSFPGFADFRANVTFVPIQFFTCVLPYCSRGVVRIVGYALRKVLGWVDEHGNPTHEQLRFTYRELVERAGVSRDAITEALRETMERNCLRCVQSPQPDGPGRPARSGIYELCWDDAGRYTDAPNEFRGFYFPEAAVVQVREGTRAVCRPKAARKNIPNAFFDFLLPRERLSVIRVVGAMLFYSIQWGPGGERKVPVSKSISELSRLTRMSRQHVHEAVGEAAALGYIEPVDRGYFDPAAGRDSRAATYRIRWSGPEAEEKKMAPVPQRPVRKGERRQSEEGRKPGGKGERDRSEKVNQEQSEMVNDKRTKTKLKTKQTTTLTGVTRTSPKAAETGAAAESPFDLLTEAGFDARTARHLAKRHSKDTIQRQIQWLALRTTTRNRLGLLRRAIERDWPKPEGAGTGSAGAVPDLVAGQARLFASHYYAAYHGFGGEPASEPFPKDLEMTARFIPRLLAQERNEAMIPDWGRRFGRLMSQQHQNDPKAKPNLSFALVLYGDRLLRLMQAETAARRKEALGMAREAHQAKFMPAYHAYLDEAEQMLQQACPSFYETFAQQRQKLRGLMTSGPFLASAERLARFDSDESRRLEFAEFFHRHPYHPVLSFWEWDSQMNPHRFGGTPSPTTAFQENRYEDCRHH